MSNNIDLQALWQQQATAAPPDIKAALANAAGLQRKTRRKMIFTNITLLLTSIYLLVIGYFYHPTLLSVAGIAVAILAMIICMYYTYEIARLLAVNDVDKSIAEHLQQMLVFKQKQDFLQTKVMSAYFFLLSLGLAMYMTGPAARMNMIWRIAVYGITAAWVAFNWFYTRPRRIRKQKAELNAVIEKLEAVNKQLGVGEE
jgi:hypothetical protein